MDFFFQAWLKSEKVENAFTFLQLPMNILCYGQMDIVDHREGLAP